jgi:Zinc knuckle
MQDTLTFDSFYTNLSASVVTWENEVLRSGYDPYLADDRRKPVGTATSFVGCGAQYANPVQRRLPAALSMDSPRYHHRRQTSTQNSIAPSRFQKRDNRDNMSKDETHCFKCGQQGHWRAECTNCYGAEHPRVVF